MGLVFAVMGLSRFVVLRQISRFYVEVIRGIPILVLLFYIAFVAAPGSDRVLELDHIPAAGGGLVDGSSDPGFLASLAGGLALTIGYSAFIAEVFRAGIQSVDRGQIEAAKALGLNGWQRFRLIVFPQAIRTILPPLGNDFVAMVKDFFPCFGTWRCRHHPDGQGLCLGLVPVFRNLFDCCLYLSGADHWPVADAAAAGEAPAAEW